MKLPCWLKGHRATNVRHIYTNLSVRRDEYIQGCANCPKVQTFIVGESGRYGNSQWYKPDLLTPAR